MAIKRREFIKSIGVGIASLMLTQCGLMDNAPDPTLASAHSSLNRLRRCWLSLQSLADETRQNYQHAEQTKGDLLAQHHAALNELVRTDDLDAVVAELIQAAYAEATYHIWRSNAPITCYEPMLVDYTPTSRDQLIQQVSLLAEFAEKQKLDEKVIAKAQLALQRDIAFLNLSNIETEILYEELIAAAGETLSFPHFDEIRLEIREEALEAAGFLVGLFLENH